MTKMDETVLNRLTEQVQDSLNKILENRVILTSNAVELYRLFEKTCHALKRAGNDDPEFINILVNAPEVSEQKTPPAQSLLLEINELIVKLDEFV